MCVILSKLSYPYEAMQNTGFLMPVNRTKFKISQGQVPVTADFRFVYEHVGKTVHRFYTVTLIFYLREIHIFPVMIKMSGFLPEINLQDLGTHDHFISPFQMLFPFPILNNRPQHCSFGMKYDKTCPRFIVYLEEKR